MNKYISVLIRVEDVEAFAHVLELVATSAHVAADEGFFTDEEYGEGAMDHITDHALTVLDFARSVQDTAPGGAIIASANGLQAQTGSLLN